MRLAVVTGMMDPDKTVDYWSSWRKSDRSDWAAVLVLNGGRPTSFNATATEALAELSVRDMISQAGYGQVGMQEPVGPIRAFVLGVRIAAALKADLVACLHDDLRIDQPGWAALVEQFFDSHSDCLLAGFGGAYGVGTPDWDYCRPAESGEELVRALARHDFVSNMQEAEAHGRRITGPRRVAVLDGFSLIGRTRFMVDAFERIEGAGLVHHAYDTAISLMARQAGGSVYMLPVACHHHGGLSAVASAEYHEALKKKGTSDQEEWMRSHEWLYRQVQGGGLPRLPIDVREDA